MTAVQLATSIYDRTDQPPVALSNMMREDDPTNVITGKVYLPRPGLSDITQLSQSPIRGLAQQDGVFNGDAILVAGVQVSRMTSDYIVTPIGAMTSALGYVQIVFRPLQAFFVGHDGILWWTDGTTLHVQQMPDDVPVLWAASIDSYILIGQGGGSQRIYWLEPGSNVVDPLNFFSAESQPDGSVTGVTLADDIWIFGTSSTEVWSPSGDNTLPFTRSQGRLYDKGCASRDCVAQVDNTIFWIAQDGIAYRADSVPIRISDNTIEQRLRGQDGIKIRSWAFPMNGHTFWVVSIGGVSTVVYDVSQQNWLSWSSYDVPYWRAHLGFQFSDGTTVAGDSISNDLYLVDPDTLSDVDGPIVREVTGFVSLLSQYARCNSLTVSGARGRAADYVVTVFMDVTWSDDEGMTWTAWRRMSLGKRGQYGIRLQLQGLGRMFSPGRIFKFRSSDASGFRLSYARINEGASNGA